MNRYDYKVWENDDGALEGWLSESETGDYCQYEEARLIEVDRDIKAANLQLLVEKVLAYDALDRGTVDEIDAACKDMVDLARSLKQ